MLDDLKKERQTAQPARDLFKLALYVVGMLIFGIVIFAGNTCNSTPPPSKAPDTGSAEADRSELPRLDPAELTRLVEASGAEPYRYSAPGIEYVLRLRRTGRLGALTARLDPGELAGRPLAEARGRVFELRGRVSDVSREVYTPGPQASGEDRLWSVVLEGADGSQAVALKYAIRSEPKEGRPRDAKPPRVPAESIRVGQYVVVRGVYVQQRTGTLGETSLPKPAPVLLASKFRILLPPEEHSEVISGLDEALWEDVQDRYSRESRRWDEDAVFEVIQWARERGYEACRDDLKNGTLPWTRWGARTFEVWKKEVSVGRDDPRPFTEGARGQVFRTSGIVAEVLAFDWEGIPPNHWNVDHFQLLRMLSDHYQNVSMSLILPFPIDTFEGVTGKMTEHVRVFGVFVKNETYDSKFKREDGSNRSLPITAPMFVVLHIERYPEDAASSAMRELMWWIAGSMVLFGLLFYIVLIRGGSKQAQRMEAHRLALRQRIRAKGQGPQLTGRPRPETPGDDPGDSGDGGVSGDPGA